MLFSTLLLSLVPAALARIRMAHSGAQEDADISFTNWPRTKQWSHHLPALEADSNAFYKNWLSEFDARRSDPESTFHYQLAKLHPNHSITAVSQPNFDLFSYAQIPEHGLSIRKRPASESIVQEVYLPAAKRREGSKPHVLLRTLVSLIVT